MTIGEQAVRKVVIAGGGTAGWIMAAALAKNLGPLLEIVLIESDEIGTVGVGESTIPTARRFHELIGVEEVEFVRATQSSFKLGIRFDGWREEGQSYFHSFGTTGRGTWIADFQHIWMRGRELGLAENFGRYCLEHEAALSGKFKGGRDTPLNYAYHLDATAYGRFLRAHAEAMGVCRREGRIATVECRLEDGFVAALVLESGERIAGDLFIDCTGFRGLIIDQALGVDFEDWGQWLPTDSAVAVQTEATADPPPYTRAIAHRAGWQWRIPLQSRVGNGLVYASRHMSDDEARALLRQRTDGTYLTDPRTIRFRTGMRRETWHKNCVAVGLSAGFIEPLESTSIHLIMVAAIRLLQFFPFDGVTSAARSRFNAISRHELEHIRDFIILHYHLNERPEPFWKQMREAEVPETLRSRIEAFRTNGYAFQDPDELFRADSWVQVMLGQGIVPASAHPFGRLIDREDLRRSLAALRQAIVHQVDRLPEHDAYLHALA